MRALAAFAIGAVFSVATVWVPALASLTGFAWIIGAALGAVLHLAFMGGHRSQEVAAAAV